MAAHKSAQGWLVKQKVGLINILSKSQALLVQEER